MRADFAGRGRMGRPVCANLVWAGYVVTAADVRGQLDSMVVRWGGTPAETAAEAEVLITILPGSQELHDVMIIPRSTRGPASPA
jgi:3-hydroxyisobutyrate dehydrogenase